MRSSTSAKAGVSLYHELPKSPGTSRIANFQYCTYIGLSRPSSLWYRSYSSFPAFWGRRSRTGSPITWRIANARIEIPTTTTTSCRSWWTAYRLSARRLFLPRRREEHPVDLVRRRLVLDTVRDAPHAAQPPLEDVAGVVEEHLLRLHVNVGALLLVERRAALDDEVVQLLVAVVAVGLAALEDVVQDRVGVEHRVVAPREVEHRALLVLP